MAENIIDFPGKKKPKGKKPGKEIIAIGKPSDDPMDKMIETIADFSINQVIRILEMHGLAPISTGHGVVDTMFAHEAIKAMISRHFGKPHNLHRVAEASFSVIDGRVMFTPTFEIFDKRPSMQGPDIADPSDPKPPSKPRKPRKPKK